MNSISRVSEPGVQSYRRALQLHADWLAVKPTTIMAAGSSSKFVKIAGLYEEAGMLMRDKLSKALFTYDTQALATAIFILVMVGI